MGTDIIEFKLGKRNVMWRHPSHAWQWTYTFKLIIPLLLYEMWAHDRWNLSLQDFFKNLGELVLLYPMIDSFINQLCIQ